MIGFSFGAGGRASGSTFDPATLSLTGWWRASYSASPWTGTASAGSSGSNNLTEATNPPSAGTAVNGLNPADFDGTNDTLNFAGTLDTYGAALAFSGWVLFYCDTLDRTMIYSAAASLNIYPGSPNMIFGVGASYVQRAVSASTWTLATWRYTGSNLQVGINEIPGSAGGASTTAYSTSMVLTDPVTISSGGSFWDGKILDIGMSDTSLTDQNFTDIKSYCNARYGLAL